MCKYIGFELVELASEIRDRKRDLRVLVAKELDYSRETACPGAFSSRRLMRRGQGKQSINDGKYPLPHPKDFASVGPSRRLEMGTHSRSQR
jgi:hypothetical protein